MDPQKKKEESLKHDRRNTYGENDKSSRKAIRRRKRLVNQIYRHKVNQALVVTDVDSTEDRVAEIRRPDWKKMPDQPLGEVLLDDLIHEVKTCVSSQSFHPMGFNRLEELMEKEGWEKPGIRVVIRQLKAMTISPWPGRLDMDLQTARKLIPLLREITSGSL